MSLIRTYLERKRKRLRTTPSLPPPPPSHPLSLSLSPPPHTHTHTLYLSRSLSSRCLCVFSLKQVLDATKPLFDKCKIEKELEGFGIRLNKEVPEIKYRPKSDGGVSLLCPDDAVDVEECKAVLREYRVHNADIKIRYSGATIDDVVDVVEGTCVYMPTIYVLNKIDSLTMEELETLCKLPHVVPISSNLEWNFDELLETIWEYGKMMRIYTKPKGQIPDYEEPVIL